MDCQIHVVQSDSLAAQLALHRYYQELAVRLPQNFNCDIVVDAPEGALDPPNGAFVVAGPLEDPVGCGAIQFLDDERDEVKRMWVAPSARGNGLAARILTQLEDLVRRSGRRTVVLDTNKVLLEAVRLYRRCGYAETAPYNENPNADYWFMKSLY